MNKEISATWLWHNESPVCPYCKAVYDESYLNGDEDDLKCHACGLSYSVIVYIKTTYSTEGSCKVNNQLPHALYRYPGDRNAFTCLKCYQEFYDFHLPGAEHPKLMDGEFKYVTLQEDDSI